MYSPHTNSTAEQQMQEFVQLIILPIAQQRILRNSPDGGHAMLTYDSHVLSDW